MDDVTFQIIVTAGIASLLLWTFRFRISLVFMILELGISRKDLARTPSVVGRITLIKDELELRYENLCWGIRSLTARLGRIGKEGMERDIYEAIDALSHAKPTSTECQIIQGHLEKWIFFGKSYEETRELKREARYLYQSFRFVEEISARYCPEHSSAS